MAGITGRNPSYEIGIHIQGQGDLGDIHAYLPEQVSMTSESNWESLLGTMPLGDDIKNFAGTAGRATGYQINPILQTICGWTGNTPLTWSFDLQFNAVSDPVRDVLDPIVRLLALTMPIDLGNGMVQAPGPNAINLIHKALGNTATGNSMIGTAVSTISSLSSKTVDQAGQKKGSEESCTLYIGDFMTIQNVVVTDVNPRFDTQFHNGLPISAEATVGFKMVYAPTRDILNSMFNNRSNR